MRQEIKERWVTALRSGDFRQGKQKLARQMTRTMPMTHCCLGVLCELAVEDGITEALNYDYGASGQIRYFGSEGNWKATALPKAVADWAGFGETSDSMWNDPKLFDVETTDDYGQTIKSAISCSAANDGYSYHNVSPMTFEQIADLIERNL